MSTHELNIEKATTGFWWSFFGLYLCRGLRLDSWRQSQRPVDAGLTMADDSGAKSENPRIPDALAPHS